MRTAATFKMLPDPAFVVSWVCFVRHNCPWHQLYPSTASTFELCLLWSPYIFSSATSHASF